MNEIQICEKCQKPLQEDHAIATAREDGAWLVNGRCTDKECEKFGVEVTIYRNN